MAIADMCHCENLPDAFVESDRFKLVLKLAKLVTNDYKPPGRKKVGGELLDLNFKSCQENNMKSLLKEASTFGLSFLSDGATVKKMPLLNVLGMCGGSPPATVAIIDATEHLRAGGKKDATFISKLMNNVVKQYDPNDSHTDLFWFDGASNVQKGGQILEAIYPRSYSLHGGEHVISLFFDDLAKLEPIKVS